MIAAIVGTRGGVAPTALTAGTIAATAGDTQVTVSETVAPSGGTGPYTRNVYRSTTVSVKGSLVDADASLPFVDTGLTNGTPYYHTVEYVDALSATADSNQTTATPEASSLAFESSWAHGAGTAELDVTDNGAWNNIGGNAVINADGRTLDTVTAASVDADTGTLTGYTGNVLRMRMRAACYGQIRRTEMVPASTDHYIRDYWRSDAGRRSQHGSGHIAGASFNHWQILSYEHNGGTDAAAELRWGLRTAGSYPDGRFSSPALSKGTWYRREVWVEFITATTVKVWPRIYNLAGDLLYDSDDFANDEAASSLTAFWASNTLLLGAPDDTADASEARDFTLGLEDPTAAGDYDPVTPAYIYVAKFAVSLTDWVGA